MPLIYTPRRRPVPLWLHVKPVPGDVCPHCGCMVPRADVGSGVPLVPEPSAVVGVGPAGAAASVSPFSEAPLMAAPAVSVSEVVATKNGDEKNSTHESPVAKRAARKNAKGGAVPQS